MAKIMVTPGSVMTIERTVQSQAAAMEGISATIGRVLNDLDMKISSEENIRQNLNSLRQKSRDQQQKLEGMDATLVRVIDQFQSTDKKLSQNAKELGRMCDRIRVGALGTPGLTELIQKSFPVSSAIGALTGITQSGFLSIQEALKAIHGVLNTQVTGTSDLPAGGQALYEYLLENDPQFTFSKYNDVLRFLNDVKWYEIMGYGMTNAGDVLKAILNGGSFEGAAEEMMNDPDKCKALLRGVIDDLTDTEYMDIIPGDGETVLKNVKKLAELGGYEDTADMIEMFQKATGYAEDADRILKDYSDNIEMLKSLKSIAPGSSMLNKHVDNLITEYQNQFQSDVMDYLKSNAEKGIVKGVDTLLGSKFGMVTKVLDKTLGQTDTMKGFDKVIHVSEMQSDAIRSFQNAAEKIRSGSFTETDMTKYQNSFNVAKSLTIEQYKGMLEYYGKNTSQGRHIADRISQLERMTCQNFSGSTGNAGRGF